MTSAFKKYWDDVWLPIVCGVGVIVIMNITTFNFNSLVSGSCICTALILGFRLAVEPIHAAQRRRFANRVLKGGMNSMYGKIGYYGGRVEKLNDSDRH